MLKKLILLILLISIITAYPLETSQFAVFYEGGQIAIGEPIVAQAPPTTDYDEDFDYILKTKSVNKTFITKYFKMPLEVSITPDEECYIDNDTVDPSLCNLTSTFYIANSSFTFVRVPFSPGATSVEIYDKENNLVAQKDIAFLSCGNLVCDDHETEISCPGDCSQETQETLLKKQEGTSFLNSYKWHLMALAIMLAITIILYSLTKRKSISQSSYHEDDAIWG